MFFIGIIIEAIVDAAVAAAEVAASVAVATMEGVIAAAAIITELGLTTFETEAALLPEELVAGGEVAADGGATGTEIGTSEATIGLESSGSSIHSFEAGAALSDASVETVGGGADVLSDESLFTSSLYEFDSVSLTGDGSEMGSEVAFEDEGLVLEDGGFVEGGGVAEVAFEDEGFVEGAAGDAEVTEEEAAETTEEQTVEETAKRTWLQKYGMHTFNIVSFAVPEGAQDGVQAKQTAEQKEEDKEQIMVEVADQKFSSLVQGMSELVSSGNSD